MNIVEVTSVAAAALPIAQLRAHLRLGTGFGEDSLQDGVLETCLRGALARIEGHCGKVILERDLVLRLGEWRDHSRLVLPLAPVRAVTAVVISDRTGAQELVDPSRYRLIRDTHAPIVISSGYMLPRIPLAGQAEVSFTAGYGAWGDVPGDMAQAVLMLAAAYYENRDAAGAGALPGAVAGLLTRYRSLRMSRGAGA
ncbi:head-tail connector protein [Oceaniglobus trochenteri]|uniref:head-tail connector protein n=1 Tax=Oceaniglobus trochenteri TaxID=2763260 RepID=UPI001CFFABA6|nr:hypothetical protein [Oceaniglobus trochenteri]